MRIQTTLEVVIPDDELGGLSVLDYPETEAGLMYYVFCTVASELQYDFGSCVEVREVNK